MSSGYVCYRYFDSDGELAYIGRTKNLANRVKQHCFDMYYDGRPRIEFTPCDDYQDSVDLEAFLLNEYRPYMNYKIPDYPRYRYNDLEWYEYKGWEEYFENHNKLRPIFCG